MTLTVELAFNAKQTASEVAICCDDQGLELIIEKLTRLRGKRDHTHLMTPAWAGNELTEQKHGGDGYVLVNHLRLVKF